MKSSIVFSFSLLLALALRVDRSLATDAQGNVELPFQPERYDNMNESPQRPPNAFVNQPNAPGPANVAPFAGNQYESEVPQMNGNPYGPMMNAQTIQQQQQQPHQQMYQGPMPSYGGQMAQNIPYQSNSPMVAMSGQPMNPQMPPMNPAMPINAYPPQQPQPNLSPYDIPPSPQQSTYPVSPNEETQVPFARVMTTSPGQPMQAQGPLYPVNQQRQLQSRQPARPQYSNFPGRSVSRSSVNNSKQGQLSSRDEIEGREEGIDD